MGKSRPSSRPFPDQYLTDFTQISSGECSTALLLSVRFFPCYHHSRSQSPMEGATILCESDVLQPNNLPVVILNNENGKTLSNELVTPQASDDPHKMKILASLEKNRWNKTLAAKDLNISRATLWRKMKAYSLHNN